MKRVPIELCRFLLLLLLGVAAPAHATQLISEILQHQDGEGANEVELVLGTAFQLETTFNSVDDRTYEAKLAHRDEVPLAWEMAELTLDEPGYDVTRVTVEGSTARGFTLQVAFSAPVVVATVPQFAANRIVLKYMDRRAYRQVARRAGSKRPTGDFWAVDLGVSTPLLSLQQVPRSILLNRVLYFAPIADAPQMRVRVGFLEHDEAFALLRQAQGQFPQAALVQVSGEEASYAAAMRLNSERINRLYSGPRAAQPSAAAPRIVISTSPAAEPDPAAGSQNELRPWQAEPDRNILMEARDAYLAGDYNRAVTLYTKAGETPAFRQEALEMLGVSREQKRQLAQAKLAYGTLVHEYPGTEAAERATARLQAIVSTDRDPRALREPLQVDSPAWAMLGNLSQFYRRQSIDIERRGTTVAIDGLFTDATLGAQRQGRTSSHEARISVGHIQDFADRASNRNFRVQELFWESRSTPMRTGARIGRQRQRSSGVLERFDGLTTSYYASDRITLNALGGYLVDSSYDGFSTDRPFWGMNAEVDLFDEALTLTPFYVQQKYDGVLDRRAVGLQGELYAEKATYFAMADYDLHHKALNHLYLMSNYTLSRRARLHAVLDHRRSPYLTTRNALIGRPVTDLSELELQLVEESLEDIARDRSAFSTTLRLGMDGSLFDGWSYSMDASVTDFEASETSMDVAGLAAHKDYFYGLQVRADDAFGAGNYGAVQLRYYTTDSTDAIGLYFNNRFTLAEAWWLYPRLQVDQRKSGDNRLEQLRLKPSLRLDYRYSQRFRIELEAGYEWTSREMTTGDLDMQGVFVSAGYRAMF